LAATISIALLALFGLALIVYGRLTRRFAA
jgi:hypothetical protein